MELGPVAGKAEITGNDPDAAAEPDPEAWTLLNSLLGDV